MTGRRVGSTAECPACGKGRLRGGYPHQELLGIDLGTYPALVCNACGESFLNPTAMSHLEAKAKTVGLWGSSDWQFMRLSARFQEEAGRRGITKAALLRALRRIRREKP